MYFVHYKSHISSRIPLDTEFTGFSANNPSNSSLPIFSFSKSSFAQAKDCIAYLNQEEITTAFISFGGAASTVAKDLGFCNILDVTSSASELRRAFDCLSKSVIESSKSVVADGDDFFQI